MREKKSTLKLSKIKTTMTRQVPLVKIFGGGVNSQPMVKNKSNLVNFLLKFVIIIFSISIFFAFLDFKAYGVVIGLVALLS